MAPNHPKTQQTKTDLSAVECIWRMYPKGTGRGIRMRVVGPAAKTLSRKGTNTDTPSIILVRYHVCSSEVKNSCRFGQPDHKPAGGGTTATRPMGSIGQEGRFSVPENRGMGVIHMPISHKYVSGLLLPDEKKVVFTGIGR